MSRFYRPVLNDSVDVKLQTAFNDGQWTTVARLAAQRYKMKKDPYYETIRVCAESQLDSVADKAAVVFAVDALVRDKTAIADIDSVELYEWALQELGLPHNYSKTIGVLRARWAKANPSDPAVLDCLEACVSAWDLVNAQQIAATLDRGQSGKHDGKTMFWNITLTHLLSTNSQCPENMSVMFAKLARVQLDKAAAASTSTTNGKSSARGLKEEEEINLYYRVVGKEAFLKSVSDPSNPISVHSQFAQGRKHLLHESLRVFEDAGDWENLYRLCEHAFGRHDQHGATSSLVFDLRTWKLLIKAATMQPDIEEALANAASILDKFVTTATISPVYRKNIGLATLELAFQGSVNSPSGISGSTPSPRTITLFLILEQCLMQRSAFDDVKQYVCQLSFEEAKYFIDNFSRILLGENPNEQKQIVVGVLAIKFRYLLSTCPLTLEHLVVVGPDNEQELECRLCDSASRGNCKNCLERVASSALCAYKDIDKTPEALQKLDKDPRTDLALVAVSALLKLSGLRQTQLPNKLSPLSDVKVFRLLQATAILATQVERTSDDVPLRLLLVKVYLLLGCAKEAYLTWLPMDVKRTIQDALSPLFFDRLSTISPGLFLEGRRSLTEPLASYYYVCLREPSPVKIWDAFSSGNYTSILDMAEYSDRLRRSCTLVMTVVESRRALRACGGHMVSDIERMPLLSHIDDKTTFVSAIDHGSFPNLERVGSSPLHELVKLGPELSSERCRLALLAEHFIDVVTYKAPKEYRPTRPDDAAVKDKAYLIETFSRLHASFSSLMLSPPAAASKLTGPENKFYSTLTFLSALLCVALQTARSEPLGPSLSPIITGVKSRLEALHADLAAAPPQFAALDMGTALYSLTDPHTLTHIREAALATKQTTSFLLSFHAAEQARDRTGKSNLHKEVVAEVKALDTLATTTLAAGRAHVKQLKEALGQGGWLDRAEGWMFPTGGADGEDALDQLVRDVVGAGEVEEWAGKLVESWREGIKGFGMVVWE